MTTSQRRARTPSPSRGNAAQWAQSAAKRGKNGGKRRDGRALLLPGAVQAAKLARDRRLDQRREVLVHPGADHRLHLVQDLAVMDVDPLFQSRDEGVMDCAGEDGLDRAAGGACVAVEIGEGATKCTARVVRYQIVG